VQSDVEVQQASSSEGWQAIVIRGISDRQLTLIQQSEDVGAVVPEMKVRVPDGLAPATMDLMSISAGKPTRLLILPAARMPAVAAAADANAS
jgi:hypothetical protein